MIIDIIGQLFPFPFISILNISPKKIINGYLKFNTDFQNKTIVTLLGVGHQIAIDCNERCIYNICGKIK